MHIKNISGHQTVMR